MRFEVTVDGSGAQEVVVTRRDGGATLWLGGRAHRASLRPAGRAYELSLDDRAERVWLVADHDRVHIHALGRAWTVEVVDPVERELRSADLADAATAPMPGMVISTSVGEGDTVTVGQQLLVIESMKLQSEIVAWRDGVVESVHVQVGETFDRGSPLLTLEAEED